MNLSTLTFPYKQILLLAELEIFLNRESQLDDTILPPSPISPPLPPPAINAISTS